MGIAFEQVLNCKKVSLSRTWWLSLLSCWYTATSPAICSTSWKMIPFKWSAISLQAAMLQQSTITSIIAETCLGSSCICIMGLLGLGHTLAMRNESCQPNGSGTIKTSGDKHPWRGNAFQENNFKMVRPVLTYRFLLPWTSIWYILGTIWHPTKDIARKWPVHGCRILVVTK